MSRILVIEDERSIAAGLEFNLKKEGHDLVVVSDGLRGLEAAQKDAFDLIVLDVMLPGLDGFEVCRRLRESGSHTPVLMLTARHDLDDKVQGLSIGADDYLGKPFELGELRARVGALLRRAAWRTEAMQAPQRRLSLAAGLVLDLNRLELSRGDQVAVLTPIEAKLLGHLVETPGITHSRSELLRAVWGFQGSVQTRTLDNFVMRLRQHLGELGANGASIVSVRGVGYRWESPR